MLLAVGFKKFSLSPWCYSHITPCLLVSPTMSDVIRVNYLRIAWCRVFLETLIFCQIIKQTTALYGTLIFINAFTRFFRRSNYWANKSHSLTPIPEVAFHYNSLVYTRPSKGYFLQVSPPIAYMHFSPPPYVLYNPPYSLFLNWSNRKLYSGIYKSLNSSICSLLHYPFIWSFLGANIPVSTLFTNNFTLSYFPQCEHK